MSPWSTYALLTLPLESTKPNTSYKIVPLKCQQPFSPSQHWRKFLKDHNLLCVFFSLSPASILCDRFKLLIFIIYTHHKLLSKSHTEWTDRKWLAYKSCFVVNQHKFAHTLHWKQVSLWQIYFMKPKKQLSTLSSGFSAGCAFEGLIWNTFS